MARFARATRRHLGLGHQQTRGNDDKGPEELRHPGALCCPVVPPPLHCSSETGEMWLYEGWNQNTTNILQITVMFSGYVVTEVRVRV